MTDKIEFTKAKFDIIGTMYQTAMHYDITVTDLINILQYAINDCKSTFKSPDVSIKKF